LNLATFWGHESYFFNYKLIRVQWSSNFSPSH
jgi:hypothetical protein